MAFRIASLDPASLLALDALSQRLRGMAVITERFGVGLDTIFPVVVQGRHMIHLVRCRKKRATMCALPILPAPHDALL